MAAIFGFQWHITDRCNMRCKHCYQAEYGHEHELAFADLKACVDEIFRGLAGQAVSVALTGGEPFLHPDFHQLVDYLEAQEQLADWQLICNGTLIDAGLSAYLSGCEKLSTIKLSLEAVDPEINALIRPSKHFQLFHKGLPFFQKTQKELIMMVTLNAYNYHTIAAIADWAFAKGFHGVMIERFVPQGSGRSFQNAALDANMWFQAVQQILTYVGLEQKAQEFYAYHAFWLNNADGLKLELKAAACNLGPDSMALLPDGTVLPCRRLLLPVGNLLESSFEALRQKLARYEPAVMRKRLQGKHCGSCQQFDCTGCRAQAYACYGDANADDPLCLLRHMA